MKYESFVKHDVDITCLTIDKYIFVLCLLSGNSYIFLQKKEMPLVTSCLKMYLWSDPGVFETTDARC